MDFLENLNDAQRQAVTAPLEPILVLAGPGTGKTRTLVGRILYLIRHYHIPPHRILAVTFTNKAKEEMKHRLRNELGDFASDLKIGTFHRFCMTILREHYGQAGLPKQFAVADETTQLMALSRASRIQDEKSLHTVLNAISSYRLNEDHLNLAMRDIAMKWITPYHHELWKNKLIDFDQILMLTQDLFAHHPELVETYRQTFDAILVDEFQDTDPIQYDIMKSLAYQHGNIFVVADDDQSIFAWRGAHIENIDRYTQDFDCQEEQVIVLHENYRSAQCIIDVATQLINCGPRFREKYINAVSSDSKMVNPEIRFLSFPDDEAEIQFISDQILELKQTTNFRYADMAILYPTHTIGDRLEAKLLAVRIPCQLVKRQGVFDQEDVRKIILLLKLLQNPWDDLTLEQFFQLELRNDLVFQQIKSLKTKNQTFRRTLYQLLSWREEMAGISKSELRRTITTTFGIISNMLSYLEQNPTIELSELINTFCNLTAPDHTATIHSNVHQLTDPYEISGIKDATEKIRSTASQGGTIYVCGEELDIVDLCCDLLYKMGATPSTSLRTGSQVASLSETDIFLCLDEVSAKILRVSYPNIPDSQIILITTNNLANSQSVTLSEVEGRTTIFSPFTTIVTVFKLIQAFTSEKTPTAFRNYTVIDLETTSGDIRTTRIVEIGAVKVRDGNVSDTFGTLVNPEQPITQGAYNVHHISDAAVRDAKTFAELLPEFVAFIGDDLLVAHNGFSFDFPILMRLYKETTGKTLSNRRFDTLPLARRLFSGQSASMDALMQRFNIQKTGERHRALDDTVYLAQIFEHLQAVEQSVNRRSEHEELLELVALGIYLERLKKSEIRNPKSEICSEERLLFQLGAKKLLSRFSGLPDQFRELYLQHQIALEHLFEQLSSDEPGEEKSRHTQVFTGRDAAISHLKDLANSFATDRIRDAIQRFLDHATLYTTQDDIQDVNAVNLLTIHSAKGLEFPVVFISGVEKGNLPSFYSVREEGELGQKKLDEQRRLFYVAMTRAKQKLIVTYVNKRGEYERKRSQFLVELGVEREQAEPDPEPLNM
jgi:DNA helicase-2/ATP-dependent DNA helicase PcrA